jgi:hypothetical protein
VLGKTLTGCIATPQVSASFDAAVAALDVKAGALDGIAEVALRLYLASHEITTLHGVTSTHALRLLLPYLEQPELALRRQFQAVLALGLTITERSLRELSNRSSLASSRSRRAQPTR